MVNGGKGGTEKYASDLWHKILKNCSLQEMSILRDKILGYFQKLEPSKTNHAGLAETETSPAESPIGPSEQSWQLPDEALALLTKRLRLAGTLKEIRKKYQAWLKNVLQPAEEVFLAVEHEKLKAALEQTNWIQSEAARRLKSCGPSLQTALERHRDLRKQATRRARRTGRPRKNLIK